MELGSNRTENLLAKKSPICRYVVYFYKLPQPFFRLEQWCHSTSEAQNCAAVPFLSLPCPCFVSFPPVSWSASFFPTRSLLTFAMSRTYLPKRTQLLWFKHTNLWRRWATKREMLSAVDLSGGLRNSKYLSIKGLCQKKTQFRAWIQERLKNKKRSCSKLFQSIDTTKSIFRILTSHRQKWTFGEHRRHLD